MNASDILEWVKTLLTFLGPIAVVVVTARMERNRKADAKVKALEDEKRERKEQDLKDKLESIHDEIDATNKRIDQLNARIDKTDQLLREMQEFDKATKEDMRILTISHRVNSSYVHELAHLVEVLAEGMRDQHLDGNITKAIAEYRNFEQSTLARLMSSPNASSELDLT